MDSDAAATSEFPSRPESFALSVAADHSSGAWPFPGKPLIICERPPCAIRALREWPRRLWVLTKWQTASLLSPRGISPDCSGCPALIASPPHPGCHLPHEVLAA